MTGPRQAIWTERLERDYGNVRAALGWLVKHDEAVPAARLCLGLWRYWRNGSSLSEGRAWLAQVLAAAQDLPPAVHAEMLIAAHANGETDQARSLLAQALVHRYEIGDREDLAISLDRLANVLLPDNPAFAASLAAVAGELRRRHHLPNPPESETHRTATATALHRLLDEHTFAAASEAGSVPTLANIVDQVRRLTEY